MGSRQGAGAAIDADQKLFQRAIENLLRNAMRYGKSKALVSTEEGEGYVKVMVDDNGTSLPFGPIDADPADLAAGASAEPFESMLVSVGPVTITDPNPDGASDYDEFEVTGGLRINDGIAVDLDNNCPVDSDFTSIVGIHFENFGSYRINPRDAADVMFGACDPFN